MTTRPITLVVSMYSMPEVTTITIHKETHQRLMAIGKMGESYDDVVRKLLDQWEKMEKLRLKKPD